MSIFVIPTLLSQFGLVTTTLCLLLGVTFNLYSAWLAEQASKFFNSEAIPVTSMHDLTYLCFGNDVVIFQEVIRILNKIAFLILTNAYLDSES